MARNINIAVDCSDCCTCPTPTVEWESRSASKTKCGATEFGTPSSPPKYYLTSTASGYIEGSAYGGLKNEWYRLVEVSPTSCANITNECSLTITQPDTVAGSPGFTDCEYLCDDAIYGGGPFAAGFAGARAGQGAHYARNNVPDPGVVCGNTLGFLGNWPSTYSIDSTTQRSITGDTLSGASGTITENLSIEYTTADLKTYTIAALPAWDDDWDDTAGSYANTSTDETSYAARESRYRIPFKIPLVNTGLNYRVSWVERFIPEAGVGITSVEVYSRGVYRPTVTLAAPPAGGTQATAVAVMSTTGTVSSIRILNPGSGYTSAPSVTVEAASGGGTSSTGWTSTLTAGQVTAVSGGSAGDYLPTLVFFGGGGSGAAATVEMDPQGGISAVTIGAAGSGYSVAPGLTINAKVASPTPADLLLHLGTETARCAVWDGVTPGGYDPEDPTTYPIIGDGTNDYFELPVPTTDGTTLVANLRAVCDGSPCPP